MALLSQAQQEAVMDHLEQVAYATLAHVNANTGGTGGLWKWLHDEISGDDGGGGRTECNTVLNDTLPSLRATAERDRQSGDTDRWLGTALEAENSLKEVEGYTAATTVMQILRDTETASGQDLRDAADKVVKDVAAAVPWYVYLGGAAFLFWYVGGMSLLRKRA